MRLGRKRNLLRTLCDAPAQDGAGGMMKKLAVLLIALGILFCACETQLPEAGENKTGSEQHAKPVPTETGTPEPSPTEAAPAEWTITACTDALTEQESAALHGFLCSTAIYQSDDAELLAAAEWSCRLNEHCLLAVAHWKYDKHWGIGAKDGFEPVLLYEEDGTIRATEFGKDAFGLVMAHHGEYGNFPVCMSFVQQVGTTTLICFDSYDLTYAKSDRLFDNRFTEPLKLCYTDLYPALQSTWIRSGTETDAGTAFDGVNSDEYSYLFAIEDMEDNYRLYVGTEYLTGEELKALLSSGYSREAAHAAFALYAQTYSISEEGSAATLAYKSDDGNVQLLYTHNENYEEYPQALYYVSLTDGEWHAREIASSDVALEFRAGSVLVRLIQIGDCCLLEFHYNGSFTYGMKNLHTDNEARSRWYDGEFEMTVSEQCPDGIPKDAVLEIDGETYPIGQMLAGE